MFNNAAIIERIASEGSSQQVPRRRLTSDPVLPERLPSVGFIEREARMMAPKAILRQMRHRTPSPELEDDDAPNGLERTASTSSVPSSPTSPTTPTTRTKLPAPLARTNAWREPQPFEIFRAIEAKDIMFLMEIRDRAFHLLLRKTGDATPLLHAMRIGKSHRDIAIILLGAFSRWVNYLQDEDIPKPQTRKLLKALRTNLKLAINYGLAKSQSDLTASFLQTLVMSEGEKWVTSQVSNVSLALRAGTSGRPVETASEAVRKFATRELGKAELLASVEDYVSNATADLLMMGAWSIALDHIQDEPIQPYYFARDDRVFKAFEAKLHKYKSSIQKTASKRLRWQLRVLSAVMEGRSRTYRSKVETLAEQLDEGEGV